ncbi:hypothetical protein TNCV_1673781 [Trichonephila clavipes]|nr:hypothetical protein TNCV_1673781 [Trichonephila clavipes]
MLFGQLNPDSMLTARVSEGKRFSEAVLQVNSASEKRASCSKIKLIYSVNGESVEGKRFSEAVLQVNSASEKGSVLLIEDQTDLHLQC